MQNPSRIDAALIHCAICPSPAGLMHAVWNGLQFASTNSKVDFLWAVRWVPRATSTVMMVLSGWQTVCLLPLLPVLPPQLDDLYRPCCLWFEVRLQVRKPSWRMAAVQIRILSVF